MKLNYTKVRDVKDPSRAYNSDAGIDFYIPNDTSWESFNIQPHCSILIPSGIRMDIPLNHTLIAFEKSSIAIQGLICGARVVDALYQGEIHIHIINTSKESVVVKRGQKIAQFILIPIIVFELEYRPPFKLYETESPRSEGGFGSTGDGIDPNESPNNEPTYKV